MKKLHFLFALTALATLSVGHVQAQQFDGDSSNAYNDSENASTISAALPVLALGAAAILIATTNHGHSSGGGSGNSSHNHCH